MAPTVTWRQRSSATRRTERLRELERIVEAGEQDPSEAIAEIHAI